MGITPKLNVILRTCDRVSIQTDRIFPKDQIIQRCLRSLVDSLRLSGHEWSLHVIDDCSSEDTRTAIQLIAPEASFNLLPERDQSDLSGIQKSRYSVGVAYDYIDTLPHDELIYIVEDDYLHYPHAIANMIQAYVWFTVINPTVTIGIFPQDFNQMYFHPDHVCNHCYPGPCTVLPGPDRYWRTTWYTHESFMVPNSLIQANREHFQNLLRIGFEEGWWEGNTISSVWMQSTVEMLMPLGTLAVHLGAPRDISFYCNDWQQLWDYYA